MAVGEVSLFLGRSEFLAYADTTPLGVKRVITRSASPVFFSHITNPSIVVFIFVAAPGARRQTAPVIQIILDIAGLFEHLPIIMVGHLYCLAYGFVKIMFPFYNAFISFWLMVNETMLKINTELSKIRGD